MTAHRTSRPGFSLKALVIAALMLAGIIGSLPAAAAPVADTGGSGGASGNQGAAYRLFSDVFGGNTAATAALVSDSAVIHTPDGVFAGADGLNVFATRMRAPFVDATFVVNDLLASGDTVLARWTLLGSVGTSAPIVVDGLSVLRFQDGKIAESWISYDRMALSQQLEAASYTNMENARSGMLPVLGVEQAPEPDLPRTGQPR